MIQLTRLNNARLALNSDLIKYVEEAPDTVITLVNGEKILVRESADKVLERIVHFRRAVLEGIYPATGHFAAMPAGVDRTPPPGEEQAER